MTFKVTQLKVYLLSRVEGGRETTSQRGKKPVLVTFCHVTNHPRVLEQSPLSLLMIL